MRSFLAAEVFEESHVLYTIRHRPPAANWSLWEQPDSKQWIVLVDRPCRQRTFNLGFGNTSRAKFWGDSRVFAEDFSADTVSDNLHIGAFQSSLF